MKQPRNYPCITPIDNTVRGSAPVQLLMCSQPLVTWLHICSITEFLLFFFSYACVWDHVCRPVWISEVVDSEILLDHASRLSFKAWSLSQTQNLLIRIVSLVSFFWESCLHFEAGIIIIGGLLCLPIFMWLLNSSLPACTLTSTLTSEPSP